jgi:hypothetical protein
MNGLDKRGTSKAEIAFIITLVVCFLAPPAIFGQWWLFGVFLLFFGCFGVVELVAKAKTGKTVILWGNVNIFDYALIESRKILAEATVSQICDEVGKVKAMLEEDTNEIRLMSNVGKFIGKYTKRDNATYDAVGKLIARGNALMTLLKW